MRHILLLFCFVVVSFAGKAQALSKREVEENLKFCIQQSKMMGEVLAAMPDRLPKTIGKDGKLVTSKSDWWCSGFYPGVLWYLYQYSNESELKTLAQEMTACVEKEKANTTTHDLGFMMYCSFGNGFRLTGDEQYNEVLISSSKSLCNRLCFLKHSEEAMSHYSEVDMPLTYADYYYVEALLRLKNKL